MVDTVNDPDVAYYYPAPYWRYDEVDPVKAFAALLRRDRHPAPAVHVRDRAAQRPGPGQTLFCPTRMDKPAGARLAHDGGLPPLAHPI